MKINDVKNMNAAEIKKKVVELQREIFQLKIQKQTSGLEKPHQLKVVKKNVARLLTVLNSKKVS